MSRRQMNNDVEPDDHSNYLNNMMAQEMNPETGEMTFYKNQDEIEMEESKILKKLNSLKEMRGKMRGLDEMREKTSTKRWNYEIFQNKSEFQSELK